MTLANGQSDGSSVRARYRREAGSIRFLALTTAALLALGLVPAPAAGGGSSAAGDGLELWARYGTGMVRDLLLADLDGDGQAEVVVGGRGVGVIGPESLDHGQYRWANKWQDDARWGDGQVAQQLRVADLSGDGTLDVLAGTPHRLFAVDGSSGKRLWTAEGESLGEGGRGAWSLAVGEWSGAGVDVAFANLTGSGVTAVDGRDGSLLWFYPRLGVVLALESADVNGDGFTDVLAVGSVDAGFEVHAISGRAASLTGVPLPLWVQRFPGSSPSELAIGSVATGPLVGGPTEVVVVADFPGTVQVLAAATGVVLSQWQTEGALRGLALTDLEGDGSVDVVTASSRVVDGTPLGVAAHRWDGTPLWTRPTPAPAVDVTEATLDGETALVAVGGWQVSGGQEELDGFAMALSLTGEPRWEHRVPDLVDAVAVGEPFGAQTVVLGGGATEGWVHGLAADGSQRWAFRTGGRVEQVAAADVTGDGLPEVVEAASDSAVAVHDAAGRTVWRARVPGPGQPSVKTVAVGDLMPEEEGLEVVAGTWNLGRGTASLHVFSAAGELRWTREVPGHAEEVAAADIEGDGRTDVVAVTAGTVAAGSGIVGRYRGHGEVVWERDLPTGINAALDLLDVNGDGMLDLLVTRKTLVDGALWALDGRSGEVLWRHDSNSGFNWVSGSAVGGVLAGDVAGRVVRLDAATGEVVWQTQPGGSSWDGEWSVDVTGDGLPDVLSASGDGNARMLSGADGNELWAAAVDEDTAWSVATARGQGPPVVAVGSYGAGAIPQSAAYMLDAATGERLDRAPTESFVMQLLPVDLDGDGRDEVVAAAGWQVRALRAPGLLPPSATAQVTVSTPRSVFPDGLYRAGFEVEGACLDQTAAVEVASASCPDDLAPDERRASGTVRMARLGFDAVRHVEAGETDHPAVETAHASAPEQTTWVRVDLKARSDLTIEIEGTPELGLDPRPVAGSASPGGVVSDRSVVWSLAGAAPGAYEFSARFAPGAPPGFLGSFWPQVTVTSVRPADSPLDYVGAEEASAVRTERTSTLIMEQRVAPEYGGPIGTAGEYWPNRPVFPDSFETFASFDAFGAYHVPSSGPISVEATGALADIAPGADDIARQAALAWTRPWIPGADKVDPDFSMGRDEQNRNAFRFILRDYPVEGGFSTSKPPAPLGGAFWDGDAAVVGGVGAIGHLRSRKQVDGGPPTNPGGRLAADWDGQTAVAWSGLWANVAPYGEANALNYRRSLDDHSGTTNVDLAGDVVSTTGATIHIVARGGDVDNRSSEESAEGEPVTVTPPPGHEWFAHFMAVYKSGDLPYEYESQISAQGRTLIPKVPPGGHWLESEGSGYQRDPAVVHMVFGFGRPIADEEDDGAVTGAGADPAGSVSWAAEMSVVAPPGVDTTLEMTDHSSGAVHRRSLSPGVWRATLTSEGLDLVRTGSLATSCPLCAM